MKLTKQGVALNNKWYENYCRENDRLGGNSAECNFVEGWSIVDNTDYIKNLTDVCGLLIFGYETGFGWTAVDEIDGWIAEFGEDETVYGFTHAEIRAELLKYYED